MSRRPTGGYNVLASTGARSHVDAIQNGIQFRVAVHAQTSEFLNQGTKGLAPRSLQQTDHRTPTNPKFIVETSIPVPTRRLRPPWLTMMLMELSRRRGCPARTSGQARSVGWSELARLLMPQQDNLGFQPRLCPERQDHNVEKQAQE